MRKPKLYFDTPIFVGVHDIEFQEETGMLFEIVKNGELAVFTHPLLTAKEFFKIVFVGLANWHIVLFDRYSISFNCFYFIGSNNKRFMYRCV